MAKGDLTQPAAIYAKGGVFFLLAVTATSLLLFENFSLRFALLLSIAIWSACRSYYFAFYVIEKYVDPSFKFAGLIDFCRYLLGRPR